MNFRSTVVIVFLSSTLKVMSDGHRFERGEAVCILCTPQMTQRGINSRTITSREQEINASELRSAREKFPKKTKRICEACTIGSVEARVATTPPVSHCHKERRTWSKSPRDAPSPAQTPTKGPTSLTFDDTPVSKKARRSDEVDDLFQQLEDWFGVGWDEPQDVLGEPPNWELKWKHMRSRLGGLSKNFWFIPKRSMGDLNKPEEEALTSLVVRGGGGVSWIVDFRNSKIQILPKPAAISPPPPPPTPLPPMVNGVRHRDTGLLLWFLCRPRPIETLHHNNWLEIPGGEGSGTPNRWPV